MTSQSAAADPARAPESSVKALFFVTGEADPGLLPRLIEPFAKLGLVPARAHASAEDGDGRELSADLRVNGVDRQTAHLLDNALRRVVGVRTVIALLE